MAGARLPSSVTVNEPSDVLNVTVFDADGSIVAVGQGTGSPPPGSGLGAQAMTA